MRKRTFRGNVAALGLMAALAVSACGSGSGQSTGAGSAGAQTTEAQTTETQNTETQNTEAQTTETAGNAGTAESGSASAGTAAAENSSQALTAAEAVQVTFGGSDAEIQGKGAAFSDCVLTISKGGTYVLSGSLEGQILLDTDKKEEVTLVLDGLHITSEKPYAICSAAGKSVTVVLPEGTENVLAASGVCEDDDETERTEEEKADAALYIKNDLVLSGSGRLEIQSAGKAVHAKDTLTVEGGDYGITSADDAFNGKDGITVNGGSFLISITDPEEGKGMTSRGDVVLNDGSMKITASNEGIEGLTVTFNGGTWEVHSSDDGINSREKLDTQDERAKQMNNEKVHMIFNGGTVTVDAGGDGLDSNGDITVNGGLVIVSSAEHDGDNAIDMNGECLVNGGTLVATGMQGMAEPLSDESAQKIITVYFEEKLTAGAELQVLDASGEALLDMTAAKGFDCLQISLPEFSEGETYTVKAGELSCEVTVEGTNSSAGERTGGFGGRGGFGGPGGRGGFGGPEGFEGWDGQGRPEGFRGRDGEGWPEGFEGRDGKEWPDGFRGRGGFGGPEGFDGKGRPDEFAAPDEARESGTQGT